jgi:hypothetical protein
VTGVLSWAGRVVFLQHPPGIWQITSGIRAIQDVRHLPRHMPQHTHWIADHGLGFMDIRFARQRPVEMGGPRHIDRSRLRLLLASSSMAALLVAGGAPRAFSQTFDITTTPGNAIIPSSTFTAVRVATPNVSVGGSVINTGTVNAAATGILINNNATLVGGLTN